MMNPTLLSPPEILTSKRAAWVSRALFASLGALLGPLVAQYLFAPARLTVAQWLTPMLLSTAFALLCSRSVSPAMSTVTGARAAARTLRRTVALGVLNGVLCALLWSATLPGDFGSMFPAAIAFGVFYGLWMGLGFALPFTLWTFLARRNLDAPSMLSREVLTLQAGVFLSLAGLIGTIFYHHTGLQTFAQCAGVVAFSVAVIGLVGVLRVSRFFSAIETSSIAGLHIVARGPDLTTPAVVFAGAANDRLAIVAPENLDNAPFRESSTDQHIAALPTDLGLVRRALKRAVALGAVALLVVTAVDVLALCAPCLSGLACHSGPDCPDCPGRGSH